MKHINYAMLTDAAKQRVGLPAEIPPCTVCGAILDDDNTLVDAALASDCEDCRTALNIGQMSQKGCAVSPEPFYLQQRPMLGKDGQIISREKV